MTHAEILVIGCGKMGGALVSGWLATGWPKTAIRIVEAHAPTRDAWTAQGVAAAAEPADIPADFAPAAVLVAVKPQGLAAALPAVAARLAGLPQKPLIVSIVAGKPIAAFEAAFGPGTPVLRVMPNTPAAVGRGISGLFANAAVSAAQKSLGETLLAAVGETVWLATEAQMHAVTALSGSGPAYVFHLVEAMAKGGEALGLSPEVAMKLARATVTGSGELLRRSPEDAATLRANVTSPGGTTAAALAVLMDARNGMPALLPQALAAAAKRSEELAG
ncbi:pyrroline-5-carboxylate reductase [Oleispirillum naphthae]|uniref:pyrroline-5-carboxylate reductase n=1 Tax=Oleispirillum naphthae TaxID=2838853 RepID=UPI0030824721